MTNAQDLSETGFNEKASSAYNRSSLRMILYQNKNYGGAAACLYPGVSVGDLGPYGFGDRVSSVRQSNSCPEGAKVFPRSV